MRLAEEVVILVLWIMCAAEEPRRDRRFETDDVAYNAERIQLRSDDALLRTLFLPRNDADHRARWDGPCSASVKNVRRRLNETISKNGKTLVLTRVLKSRKCAKAAQRRTFNPAPNPSIPWMTKRGDEEGVDERSKRVSTDGETLPGHHGKLKKLLNLFTIVEFDNGDCAFNGLAGSCLHPIQCRGKGGKPIGTCARGFGICCYVERTCGERSKENRTYFVNEDFPRATSIAPKVCTLAIEKAHSEVRQLRLDFVIFELRGPSNGTCISDRLTVTGQNANSIVPDLCGVNSGQHVYVDVDEAEGPYGLNVIAMAADFPRKYQIKVTQIGRSDPSSAPKNCLQYHAESTGRIQTFNYRHEDLGYLPGAAPGYFNNLNYAVCLEKRKGFCSVSYENEEREDAGSESPTFELVNVDEAGAKLLPPGQGGAEVFDCPDDYIIINGLRLCGERLNDARIDSDFTKNYPVTDFSNGPFMLQVRTNDVVSGRGFSLRYKQNPCLV